MLLKKLPKSGNLNRNFPDGFLINFAIPDFSFNSASSFEILFFFLLKKLLV